MSHTLQDQTTTAARRAAVAEGILRRRPFREMAKELNCSLGLIGADSKWLKTEWAKSYGKAGQMFEQAAIDLDALQAEAFDVLDAAAGLDKLPVIDRLLKIMEQRGHLLNLFPRPQASDLLEVPTGPIELRIEMVPSGNRPLVDEDQLALEGGEMIDAVGELRPEGENWCRACRAITRSMKPSTKGKD